MFWYRPKAFSAESAKAGRSRCTRSHTSADRSRWGGRSSSALSSTVSSITLRRCGATAVRFRGKDYDLHAPFPRQSYVELFRAKNGFEFDDAPRVKKRAAELGLPPPKSGSESDRWKLMNDVFEATVEDALAACAEVPGPANSADAPPTPV